MLNSLFKKPIFCQKEAKRKPTVITESRPINQGSDPVPTECLLGSASLSRWNESTHLPRMEACEKEHVLLVLGNSGWFHIGL